jgi:hypothetical protein
VADYFLVHDRAVFEDRLRPALASAWRERSFLPCVALCREWTDAARDYSDRYHVDPNDILLLQIDRSFCFDRALWRTLVGELLLFAAGDIPEFPTNFDTVLHILGCPTNPEVLEKADLPPIQQALQGSRDLDFGLVAYRPEHAGYNTSSDIHRIVGELERVSIEAWTTEDLAGLDNLLEEEDRADELAFAREWFAALRDLYRRAADAGGVIILERIF